MILVTLIAVLFVGGLACWLSERFNPDLPRVIALLTVLLDFALMFSLLGAEGTSTWVAIFEAPWIFPFWYLVLPCCRWLECSSAYAYGLFGSSCHWCGLG